MSILKGHQIKFPMHMFTKLHWDENLYTERHFLKVLFSLMSTLDVQKT